MGGIRVNADTQESSVRGLFAAGECAAGINGANRLGGNSLSDLLVFGKRAGEYAAAFAQENAGGTVDQDQVAAAAKWALDPFERENGENPFTIQHDLQDSMQALVGIVRNEDEMQEALVKIAEFRERREKVSVMGNVDFNPGWHTSLDLHNLLNVSEAITLAAIARKESRGGHFREDYEAKDPEFAKFNFTVKKQDDGSMKLDRVPIPEMPEELQAVIKEMG